jgi:type III pantothenate kinase
VIALLDLGNTRAKFALWDGHTFIKRGVVAWNDSAAFALASAWADWPRPDRVVAASVVDSVREAMVDNAAVAAFDRPLEWLHTPSRACGVRNAYAEPARLGVDRFLAMVHAYRSGRAPCILVSAGTALTLDALAADGSHLGGLIAPGAQLMYQSVLGATARVKPDVVGQVVEAADNTADGLFSGCWHAAAALVERFNAHMAPRLGGQPRLLVGGGDGQALAALVTLATEHAPDAVLLGLAACATDGQTTLATSPASG